MFHFLFSFLFTFPSVTDDVDNPFQPSEVSTALQQQQLFTKKKGLQECGGRPT
jgi:hypothetical protein